MTAAFPATRTAFDAALAKQKGVGGASVSVHRDGAELLTLFGGEARPGTPWARDTRTITMSIAKGWAGLVMAMLADRGLLDPDERVATYWPEFKAHGKDVITVRQVLLHTAGVLGLPDVGSVLGWDGRGWDDLDAIAAALADAKPAWEPGTRTGYHAVSYGWLTGELVRRVDGRTLGTFFREEVAEPLGLRTAIGVPADQQGDIATARTDAMSTAPWPLSSAMAKMREHYRDPATLLGKAAIGDGTHSVFDNHLDFTNSAAWLAAEVPSSNGVTSAHDLARLFSAIALGGELDGVRLLSEKTLRTWSAPQPAAFDVVMSSALNPVVKALMRKTLTGTRTLAFLGNVPPKPLGPNPRSVGAGGYGGQLVIADPDRRMSVAFVRSGLLFSQKEIGALVAAVYADTAP